MKNRINIIIFSLLFLSFLMISYYFYKNNIRPKYLEHTVIKSKRYQSKLKKLNKVILPNGAIILWGDSILESLIFKNSNIYNFSIGGETVGLLKNRVKKIKYPDSCEIVIMIGINDFLFNVDIDYTIKNFNDLIVFTSSEKCFSNIYVLEILPIAKQGFFYNKDLINSTIQKFNKNIKILIEKHDNANLKLISLYDLFKDENSNLKADLTYDGIHLNSNGREMLQKSILSFLDDKKNK